MNHVSTRRMCARSTRFAVVMATVIFALVASTLMVSNVATAATGPKVVRGYIWDVLGSPVDGAEVTINILAQSDQSVRATYSETTPEDGFYSTSFAGDQWDELDTIQVIATYNSVQSDPSTLVATSAGTQWVNVSFTFEIPEFGSYLGLLIAGGAIGVVGIAVVSMKRRR